MSLLDFLFGKKPHITFTKEGRTQHEFSPEKWQAWKDRFEKDPHYDFRTHSGTKNNAQTLKAPQQQPKS